MIKSLRSAGKISFEDWKDTDSCPCGGPVLKYHYSSKNMYVVKCGYVKETFEIDTKVNKKKWIRTKAKKQPCNFLSIFQGESCEYHIEKDNKTVYVPEDPHKKLYNNLKSYFRFVFIEPRDTTIQEINLLVKNRLHRLPRKIYYHPKTGPFLVESHRETLQEYHDRIFSKEIIDKSVVNKPITIKTPTDQLELEEEFIESDDEKEESDEETEIETEAETSSDIESVIEDDQEVYDDDYDDEGDFDYNDD